MNDHQLGVSLRQQILVDLQRGMPADGRRLQALVGDLCGDRQLPLLPALRYLLMSQAFASAVGQAPPLPADHRLQLRLQQELDQVFTTAICQRMAPVLRGLLALPEVPAQAVAPATPPAPVMPAMPAAPASLAELELLRDPMALDDRRAAPTGSRGVVAVLSFMAGVLVVGVLGGLGWLLQISSRPQLQALAPSSSTNNNATPNNPAAPQASAPTPPPPAPDLEQQQANPDLAIASVQQLYTDISNGHVDAARQLFSPAAADQFDPAFFSQFQQVSVSELRETSRSGTNVNLEGVVTFVYPDGTSQSESRTFTVDTASQPALITGSSFVAVLKARG